MENFETDSNREIIEHLSYSHKFSDLQTALVFFRNEEMIPTEASKEKKSAFINSSFLIKNKSESEAYYIIKQALELSNTTEIRLTKILNEIFAMDIEQVITQEIREKKDEIRNALKSLKSPTKMALYLKYIAHQPDGEIKKLTNSNEQIIAQLFFELKKLGGDFAIDDPEE